LKLVKRSTRDSADIKNKRNEVEKVVLKMIQQVEEEMKEKLKKEHNKFA
jgi:hypothetical protein